MSSPDVDIFDAVLNLEQHYYNLGHKEGTLDAARTGRLEGRAFGIEKGFEKYLSLGTVRGRTLIWKSRTTSDNKKLEISNPRHVKHINALETLTDNPPIRNEEDDVEEVDDRIRRGRAKVKILENALKEAVVDEEEEIVGQRRVPGVAVVGAVQRDMEVEDFKIRRG